MEEIKRKRGRPKKIQEKENPEIKRAKGRPRTYKEEYAEQARKLCLLGHTDTELAEFFEVSEQTIYTWKHTQPDFLEATKKGKALADSNVAEKLYHRAMGYEHPEDDIKVVNGEIVITPTIKRYPPDTVAAIFWLKNRQRHYWKDKHEVAHVGGNKTEEPIKIVDFSIEKAAEIYKKMMG